MVDVYRWIYYYLTPEEGGPAPGSPIGLNIVRIESEPLIDAASIDRIVDTTDQAEVLMHLYEGTPDASGVSRDPCVVVWSRGDLPSVAGTFRRSTRRTARSVPRRSAPGRRLGACCGPTRT
jgi:hypothetical protein